MDIGPLFATPAEAARQAVENGVHIGGLIPPGDHEALMTAGAAAIFLPGTVIAQAAAKLPRALNERLGYAARTAAE